jgi:tetratricopeptide (TPR) repeat protein
MSNQNVPALIKIVQACKLTNNLQDAKTFLDIAYKYSNELELLDQIAYLQSEIKDYKSSITSLKKCLALAFDPKAKYAVRANLAKVYNHLNAPLLSIGYSNANLVLDPDNYDSLLEIAFAHYLNGDYTKSESMMRDLNAIPDLPDEVRGRVLYNLGSYDMEHGKFKQGLKGFIDIGHKIGIWHNRSLDGVPQWGGSIDSDKTLIIHGEGGLGDEIIGVRFVKHIQNLGMNVIWLTGHKDLVEVFNRNGYCTTNDINTVSREGDYVQCMAMYIPILLDLDKDQVWSGPYLTPDKKYVNKWRKILPTETKLLGIKWSGNPYYDQDLHRSIPVDLIGSLQYNGDKVNLQLEPELDQNDIFNARRYIESVEDTLALLYLCDNIVTSCTSIVHMSGSMDKKVIVCPPIASYYCWLGRDDNKSDWYSSNVTVIRQREHKNWTDCISKAQELLNVNH